MRALLASFAFALFAPSAHACAMMVWEEEGAVPLEQLLAEVDEATQPAEAAQPAEAVEPVLADAEVEQKQAPEQVERPADPPADALAIPTPTAPQS